MICLILIVACVNIINLVTALTDTNVFIFELTRNNLQTVFRDMQVFGISRTNIIIDLFICFQMLLMVSSILTPGTIFLMVLGAINMAYPQLSLYWSLVLNLVPVAVFILLCYVSKSDTQVWQHKETHKTRKHYTYANIEHVLFCLT